jgi:hypothetical protein
MLVVEVMEEARGNARRITAGQLDQCELDGLFKKLRHYSESSARIEDLRRQKKRSE